MSIGPNIPLVPGAVLPAVDQAVRADDEDVQRADDGEPVGRAEHEADVRRSRGED